MRKFQISSFGFRAPWLAAKIAARILRPAQGWLWGTRLLPRLLLVVALSGAAAAQNITGTVTNGTTGKPAAGDEVTLLSLSQGMQEVGSGKTDAQGRFSLAAPADQGVPHMVRVTHSGVNYFPQSGPMMPGATTSSVTVFDTAKKLDGLSQTVEVDRIQTDGKQLQVIALFAVKNDSNPPRTLDSDKTFELILPANATIDAGMARAPGGQPLSVTPIETSEKGHYAFSNPLKPGESQFQVTYHVPYTGEVSFSPKPLIAVQHFVVMTAKGMTFTPKNAQRFQSMPDQSGAGVMVATNVNAGEDLSFKVSGSGQFQPDGQQTGGGGGGGGAMGGGQTAGRDSRPGGGLGAPIESDDPMHDYRAVILGVFALVLVMGGAYAVSRSNSEKYAAATASAGEVAEVMEIASPPTAPPRDRTIATAAPRERTVATAAPRDRNAIATALPDRYAVPAAPPDRNAMLMEVMKDELFELELDRQQGKVSESEYAKAKAALDETIKRALARKTG